MNAQIARLVGSAIFSLIPFASTVGQTIGPDQAGQAPGGVGAVNPEKRGRQFIPLTERLALGVEEPTWVKAHGKVHPDVYRALAYQAQVEKNLERAADWVAVVSTEGPEEFLGYAYVVVHLEYAGNKDDTSGAGAAKIQALQDTVLSQLSAVDFRGWVRFVDRPALLGFASESGLRKLVEDKTVRAVGLDDRPYVAPTKPRLYQSGTGSVNAVAPKISAQVTQALRQTNEVAVTVDLRGTHRQGARTVESFRRGRALCDSVLAHLSAQECRVTVISDLSPYFDAWVTAPGLAKIGGEPGCEGRHTSFSAADGSSPGAPTMKRLAAAG